MLRGGLGLMEFHGIIKNDIAQEVIFQETIKRPHSFYKGHFFGGKIDLVLSGPLKGLVIA